MIGPEGMAAQGIGLEPRWGHVKLKYLLKSVGSGGTPSTDVPSFWAEDGEDGFPWVAIADMSRTSIVSTTAKRVTPEGLKCKGLAVWPSGTLLMSMYASLGHVATLGVPAATNQAILALHPRNDVDPGYLRYWLTAIQPLLKGEANSNTQDNLNAEKVANLPATKPPFEEQRRIAAFLDHETARIDELVREQERLLKQVSERFSVLRESLLIGRLRPEEGETGRLVMAGERVIPDDLAIGSARPSHWKRIPLRWLVFMKSGDAITSDNITDAGSYPVYGGNGIRGFTERMNDTGPAVLIGRQGALCGNIQRVDGPRWVSEHAVVTRPQQPSDIGWLAELLEALDLGSYSQSAAQPGLAVDRIKALTVPVPPIREQRLIAKVLARERHQLDRLVSTISDYASVLLERRSALISAAVTGQLDLRDWRPPEVDAVAQVA